MIAEWYASQRTDATGAPEVTALLSALPASPLVLDVGCGNGLPLTRLLVDHGCRVVAWGVMFHLPLPEQMKAIATVASVLKPGGWFLFTSGDEEGGKDGVPVVGAAMNGVRFFYYSFTKDAYRDVLREHGLTLEHTHLDEGKNMYYLARKDL